MFSYPSTKQGWLCLTFKIGRGQARLGHRSQGYNSLALRIQNLDALTSIYSTEHVSIHTVQNTQAGSRDVSRVSCAVFWVQQSDLTCRFSISVHGVPNSDRDCDVWGERASLPTISLVIREGGTHIHTCSICETHLYTVGFSKRSNNMPQARKILQGGSWKLFVHTCLSCNPTWTPCIWGIKGNLQLTCDHCTRSELGPWTQPLHSVKETAQSLRNSERKTGNSTSECGTSRRLSGEGSQKSC